MFVWTVYTEPVGIHIHSVYLLMSSKASDSIFHATHVGMATIRHHKGLEPSWRTLWLLAASSCHMTVSPDSRDSRSGETRAFPHLIVRHDIEGVPVQGEGHVPEDRAAILHHGHCLVQNPSLQRTVHSDLKRHKHKYRHEMAVNASLQDKVIELFLYVS